MHINTIFTSTLVFPVPGHYVVYSMFSAVQDKEISRCPAPKILQISEQVDLPKYSITQITGAFNNSEP